MNIDFARQQMVEQQVRAWDVLDRHILDVLKTVPREQFVPVGFEALAFADVQIPLGLGQSMMTPTLEGRVLQALLPEATDSVLEIGTGSGFLAACLGRHGGRCDKATAPTTQPLQLIACNPPQWLTVKTQAHQRR